MSLHVPNNVWSTLTYILMKWSKILFLFFFAFSYCSSGKTIVVSLICTLSNGSLYFYETESSQLVTTVTLTLISLLAFSNSSRNYWRLAMCMQAVGNAICIQNMKKHFHHFLSEGKNLFRSE